MTALQRFGTNGYNLLKGMKDYWLGASGDVSTEWIAEDDSVDTYVYANRLKQKAEFDSWKASKEIYCSATRATGWETSNGGDRFGIIGEFTENKGFTSSLGTGLQSGSYIVIPKTGRYRVSLSTYLENGDLRGSLHINKTLNGVVSQDIMFVNLFGTTFNSTVTRTDIIGLVAGEKLFYQIFLSGSGSLYHNETFTFVTLEFLGE